MLFRSEPLDKEELNGGVVYVLTIPRTRKVTVCDSNTLREKGAGGGGGGGVRGGGCPPSFLIW